MIKNGRCTTGSVRPVWLGSKVVGIGSGLIWNLKWLKAWSNWTSNVQRPTSNAQCGWRSPRRRLHIPYEPEAALYRFKYRNKLKPSMWRPPSLSNGSYFEFLKVYSLEQHKRRMLFILKSIEYIIRSWRLDVRCWTFVSFFYWSDWPFIGPETLFIWNGVKPG